MSSIQYHVQELVSVPTLQAILDDFVLTTSILVSAMDLDGQWLTIAGQSARHCDLVQAAEVGKAACQASDRHLVAEVNRQRRYVIRRCHAGLYDFAAPILVKGQIIGYLVGGQVLAERLDEEAVARNILRLGLDADDYRLALAQLPFLSPERLEALARLLQQIASAIAESAYHGLEQEERAEEMADLARSLSTPVIQVWERVLALPLVGPVQPERAQLVTEALLEAIGQRRAEVVLIDITGVPVVDEQVVQSLLRTARSVSLLGATCILSGIQAEIARTIVALGLDLADIPVCADLQEGIRQAIAIRER
ncbi:MAG: PocR ligand-binding domain-containing protein [Chloroflexia bacterium]|nr:PocR ligand-binding domain-containing protein [Chloroflexia bacterium]